MLVALAVLALKMSKNEMYYCKFINVCEGFIWRISRSSLNRKNKYHTNNSST